MARNLLCRKCSESKVAGERLIHATDHGGPAEYERVVFGTAKSPKAEQRKITVRDMETNAIREIKLDEGCHDCDFCGAAIRPGDLACAWSYWAGSNHRVPEWEGEYLE